MTFDANAIFVPLRKLTAKQRQGSTYSKLWRNISPEPNSGCWLWAGRIGTNGDLRYGAKGRSPVRAILKLSGINLHREQVLVQRCPTPFCVNPEHFSTSNRRGARRIDCSGDLVPLPPFVCRRGHTEFRVYRNKRRCIQCSRDREKRRAKRISNQPPKPRGLSLRFLLGRKQCYRVGKYDHEEKRYCGPHYDIAWKATNPIFGQQHDWHVHINQYSQVPDKYESCRRCGSIRQRQGLPQPPCRGKFEPIVLRGAAL